MTESIKINQGHDQESNRSFLECQVDETLRVRVYSDFEMEVLDTGMFDDVGNPITLTLPVDQFRKSFEALMVEMDARYGGRP